MSALVDFMAGDPALDQVPDGTQALVDAIRERHGAAVQGVLLYGSCRRKNDAGEGLVDLLVLVDRYRPALGGRLAAALNLLLPPNVYYLQTEGPSGTLRCKYAVIRLDQLERRVRARHDHYFWARFCQPIRIAHAEPGVRNRLAVLRADAAVSFARRVAPLLREPRSPAEFWTEAMRRTYRCELRPEPPGAAATLIGHDPDYWQSMAPALAAEPRAGLLWQDARLASRRGALSRLSSGLAWSLRRFWGKAMNLARLFKAAGTFTNGIDYLVWKVERHSGVRIEPTERMRAHPRRAAWGLAWRMWRQGGFR